MVEDRLRGDLYTSTFNEVSLLIPQRQIAMVYRSDARVPFGSEPAIAAQVGKLLLEQFPEAWGGGSGGYGDPGVMFVGFYPSAFLRCLGIECSLPWVDTPLPLGLWHDNRQCRDIAGVLDMPGSLISRVAYWGVVLHARQQGLSPEDQAKYQLVTKDWPGPGVSAKQDVEVALMFAAQLGFLRD
jgi:hypothetical protein